MKTACLQIQRNQGNDRYILQSWKLCLRRKTWSHRLNDGPSFKRDTFQIKRKQCFKDSVPCQVLQRSLRAMPSKFAILQRTHVVVFVSPHAIDVCCWLLFKGGNLTEKVKQITSKMHGGGGCRSETLRIYRSHRLTSSLKSCRLPLR